jgi:hypothetical protein
MAPGKMMAPARAAGGCIALAKSGGALVRRIQVAHISRQYPELILLINLYFAQTLFIYKLLIINSLSYFFWVYRLNSQLLDYQINSMKIH